MARKRFTTEQIIHKLRLAEIEIRQAHHGSNRVLVFRAADLSVDLQSLGIERLGLVKSLLDLV